MTRIDIDLLRYGSRGAVYRVTYDSRMLIAESRVPASDAARARLGGNSPERGMRMTGVFWYGASGRTLSVPQGTAMQTGGTNVAAHSVQATKALSASSPRWRSSHEDADKCGRRRTSAIPCLARRARLP